MGGNMGRSSNNREVKKNNRIDTLRAILACERISQPALAAKLGHSGPTVLQNVKELIALGLVQEIGMFASTGGRKAKAFAPVAGARIALGLEVTKTHIGIVAIDFTGKLLHYTQEGREFSMTDGYFRYLGDIVSDFIQKEQLPEERVLGVGISLPGILDDTGKVLAFSHVLNLKNVNTENFNRYIRFPCAFINDANAAGLAEVYGRDDLKNLVYLSLSNSVGGAILADGKLYTGDHLRAGELGHNTLVPNGKLCYCGKKGCVDAYCNANVLSKLTGGDLALFFDRLQDKEQDERMQVWRAYLENLAVVVNNLRMTFDCNIMVGGYVGGFLEEYGGDFREMLARRNPFEPDASYFKYCRHKLGASAIGAALLWVEEFIQNLSAENKENSGIE